MTDKTPDIFKVSEVALSGMNLIEAAAGTGKTYSIAIMVLRWILETDYPIDSVLAVTFTNYATAELKERILKFLEEALAFLETGVYEDGTIKTVCDRIPEDSRAKAVKKLKKAVNDFDTASIFTIHGFCQKLILEHAFELGVDFKMELSQSVDPANDAAVNFFRKNISDCTLSDENQTSLLENEIFRKALSKNELKNFISRSGIGIVDQNIKISVGGISAPVAETIAGIYSDFAGQAAHIAQENRNRKKIMGFDDILLILYDALDERNGNSETARRIRKIMKERYSFVLIDEFQDTDPLQYSIFKTLFCNGDHTVFFIGDPKQSIYAFRRADIFAYRKAKEDVKVYDMGMNFRSASAAVEAVNEVFERENAFGDDELIRYKKVVPAKKDEKYCVMYNGRPWHCGMIVREMPTFKNQTSLKKDLIASISVAITEMIKKDSSFKIREEIKNEDGTTEIKERAVKFSDIAILVAKNDFALEICKKLKETGIPSVVEADSAKKLCIFMSDEAAAMQKLISAVATKGLAEFKSLFLTFFYDKTIIDITDRNSAIPELQKKFLSYFSEWEEKGFFFAFSKFLEDETILGNLAKQGERTVSILRQLAELIHKHELSEGFSPLYTQRWFNEKIENFERNELPVSEEESIRAESGKKEYVRIMTLHKSKGLEFNIVFFPFILGKGDTKGYRWVVRHKKTDSGYEREMLLVPASDAGKPDPNGETLNDDELEEKRRIYVGITRAKYLTICYSQHSKEYLEPSSDLLPKGDPQHISFKTYDPEGSSATPFDAEEVPSEEKAPVNGPEKAERAITTEWAITSFSGMNSSLHGDYDPESGEDYDYQATDAEQQESDPDAVEEKVPLADFPRGTEVGNVLHLILEKADFASSDNKEMIGAILKKKMNFSDAELENNVEKVNKCLNDVLSAPIFEGEKTLRDVTEENRTAEMKFFITIKDDFFKEELSRLISGSRELKGDVKKGYLTGAIDLVARIDGKYYIIDWKSNDMGVNYSDYSEKNIAEEMKKHNYRLQYMIYLTAFDKYMRKVDPEYSYGDLGGIRYLFLRGVQEGRCDTGIFYDRPAESELRRIQKLFEGEK